MKPTLGIIARAYVLSAAKNVKSPMIGMVAVAENVVLGEMKTMIGTGAPVKSVN
jgi:hypothetical protein